MTEKIEKKNKKKIVCCPFKYKLTFIKMSSNKICNGLMGKRVINS